MGSPLEGAAYYVKLGQGDRVALDVGGEGIHITVLDVKTRLFKIEYGGFTDTPVGAGGNANLAFSRAAFDATSVRATAKFKVDAVLSVKVERRR